MVSNKFSHHLKAGVAAMALYAGGMGIGNAMPAVDYQMAAETPMTQTVQTAQQNKLHAQTQLDQMHFQKLLSNISGGAWFSGNEGKVADALHTLAQTNVGAGVLQKLSADQQYRIMNDKENEFARRTHTGALFNFSNNEIAIPEYMLDRSPGWSSLLTVHESEHAAQKQTGAADFREKTTSPHVYALGEQLLEADALTTELALLREKPELMPDEQLANGRDLLSPIYNDMWQANFDQTKDQSKATELTRKQFIQKMILNKNPVAGYSDRLTPEEKCNYQITQWKQLYGSCQIIKNFDHQLKEKWDKGEKVSLNVANDLKLVEKTGTLMGFSKEETHQMYQAVVQEEGDQMDAAAIALAQNPDNFNAYTENTSKAFDTFLDDVEKDGVTVARTKMQNRVNDAYAGQSKTVNAPEQKVGLTETLAQTQTAPDQNKAAGSVTAALLKANER